MTGQNKETNLCGIPDSKKPIFFLKTMDNNVTIESTDHSLPNLKFWPQWKHPDFPRFLPAIRFYCVLSINDLVFFSSQWIGEVSNTKA